MATESALASRTGEVTTHVTVVTSAVLAADAAGTDGFRASDVRFYFLLFTNWMEDDLLRPGLDIDLTQVRRVLLRLLADGRATTSLGRRPRFRLTPEGVLALVDTLADPRAVRTFEETVFLMCAAACYRDAIAARARGGARGGDRIVLSRLDPQRILVRERRRLAGALVDLEERIEAGLDMERIARATTLSPPALAELLERKKGAYQLHPMRSFSELVATLPEELARFELGPGMGVRARTLFTPLAEQLRARIAILDRLETQLRGG